MLTYKYKGKEWAGESFLPGEGVTRTVVARIYGTAL